MKLSADRSGTKRYFTAKLSHGERLDPKELEMLAACSVPMLISPEAVQGRRNNVIKYDISAYSTLAFHLSCELSREQLADLFLRCIDVFRQMKTVYLNYKNLALRFEHIFVSLKDRSVHFIYLPLADSKREASLQAFFQEMARKAGRSTYEQSNFLENCQAWLSRPAPFALEAFAAFIQENAGWKAELVKMPEREEDKRKKGPYVKPVAWASSQASSTGEFNSQMGQKWAGCTTLLGAGGGTAPLIEVDGTEPETPEEPEARYYLVRTRNGVRIEIISTLLIGTEAGSVDFLITDNNKVSRRHARFDIQTAGCTVTDQRSTNKTYVNGRVLQPFTSQFLQNGDQVRLGNEEFVFKIEGGL